MIIINADDYGMSNNINFACNELIKRKKINSISILANGNFNSKEVNKFINSGISAGIHFNLTYGKSLFFNEKSSITDHKGYFFSLKKFLFKYFTFQINKKDILNEFVAQIKFLQKKEIFVLHADGHQHLHLLPNIWKIVNNICIKFEVKRIRNPLENLNISDNIKTLSKKIIFKLISLFNNKNMNTNNPKFYGLTLQENKNFDLILNRYIKEIKNKKYIAEIMVHPSFSKQEIKFKEFIKYGRLREYQSLKLMNYEC